MSQSLRHPEILDIARRDGKVTVDGLSEHFGVTLQTIRRDLTDLAEAGRLERVHGGAVLPSGTTNIEYAERRLLNADSKTAIAHACAEAIPDEISLFLGIGSTTEAVARALLAHKNLIVLTNNMNVANILTANPGCDVSLTGGHLRRSDGGLVGPLAIDTIRQFKFDFAVIGCSALDETGDLLDFDLQEVGVSRAVLATSRAAFLVADGSKFQRHAPARIASLSELDAFFTDRALPPDVAENSKSWKTMINVVSKSGATH